MQSEGSILNNSKIIAKQCANLRIIKFDYVAAVEAHPKQVDIRLITQDVYPKGIPYADGVSTVGMASGSVSG